MKALDFFHPYIAPSVLGCPVPTLNHQLLLALREFCSTTGVWREWLDLVTADGTTDTFDHDLTGRQELVRYTRAIINDEEEGEYDVVSRKDLPPDWATSTSVLLDRTIVHLDEGQFQVFPAPVDGDTIRMEAVFTPRLSATLVDDVLYEEHAEAIAHGTLARLFVLPNCAWTNGGLAEYHGTLFQRRMNDAANKGFRQRKHKRTRKASL